MIDSMNSAKLDVRMTIEGKDFAMIEDFVQTLVNLMIDAGTDETIKHLKDSCEKQQVEKKIIKYILDKYPYQVSGGQKQRCACARAIINQPKLILADEPTGALDSHSSQALLSTIQSINESLDATILMVTHDAFSASYANRILFLRDGAIFAEILKGSDSRRVFFEKILDVLTMMGGGVNDVH